MSNTTEATSSSLSESAPTGSPVAEVADVASDASVDLTASATGSVQQEAAGFEQVLVQVVDFLNIGGPVVWVLVGLATIALTIFILKFWQFSVLGVGRRELADRALTHWRAGRRDEAIAVLEGSRQPLAQVLLCAMSGQRRRANVDLVREEAQRIGSASLENLSHFFKPMELIATVSPLLGLLGTVIGMITAFQSIETAGSHVDPALLSGGIWVALMTTAVGLTVAIPVTFAHTWLERKVDRLAHSIEDYVTQVFTVELSQSASVRSEAGHEHDPIPMSSGRARASDAA